MADKELIERMLEHFSELYTKNITPSLINLYYQALKKYSANQVRDAAYQCLEDMDKFPTPNAIIQRTRSLQSETAAQAKKTICSQCGRLLTCILEPPSTQWICPECYSGISKEETGARYQVFAEIMDTGFPPDITTPEGRFEHMKKRARELMRT